MHMDNSSPHVAEPCSARAVHAYPQVPPGVPHTRCGKKPLRPASAARDTVLPVGGIPRRRGWSPGQTNLTRDAEDAGIAPLPMASSGWTNLHHTLRSLGTQGLRTLIHKFSVQCRTPVVEKRFRPAFAKHDPALPAHVATQARLDKSSPHVAKPWGTRAARPYPQVLRAVPHTGCGKSASGLHSPMHDPSLPTHEGCMEGMRSPPRLPRPSADYCRRTACTTCNRRRRRITSARWLRSRTWMLKHSTAALKSRSR